MNIKKLSASIIMEEERFPRPKEELIKEIKEFIPEEILTVLEEKEKKHEPEMRKRRIWIKLNFLRKNGGYKNFPRICI